MADLAHQDGNIDLAGVEPSEQCTPISFHPSQIDFRMHVVPTQSRSAEIASGDRAVVADRQAARVTLTRRPHD